MAKRYARVNPVELHDQIRTLEELPSFDDPAAERDPRPGTTASRIDCAPPVTPANPHIPHTRLTPCPAAADSAVDAA